MRLYGKFLCNPYAWRERAATKVSFDAVTPIIVVPLLMFVAAQSLLCSVVVFSLTPLLIYYVHRNFLRFLMRTKFFFVWIITSIFVLMLIFEVNVVPLLEILPEENLAFMIFVIGGLTFGFITREKAEHPWTYNDEAYERLELGAVSVDACSICKKSTQPMTYHCRVCQTCVSGRQYHNKWLDCCIGASNLWWYLACLFSSAFALIFGSNLTFTTICHPFVFVWTILLPDDCSDAYHQLDISICFVGGIYSLLLGTVMAFYFFFHLWLMYQKTTANERKLLYSTQPTAGFLRNAAQRCCKLLS
ncbi:palmitoyltransferase ZDHHC23 [Phymastichus coffea]|uniref:palmitoyltransferase ZDHHC23 n=1 Tax=Phymastichus coffea TaxID=108790 RepID=UPI00273B454D|nr:palmitoyltransferase ZDHHC23 [Phymastichus coffea]